MTEEDILSQYSTDESVDYDNHLYIYGIARKDLEMTPGKLGAQLGHAYEGSIVKSQKTHPDATRDYGIDALGGSKVSLYAKNANQILRAYNEARQAGLPCKIVVDRHHIMPPHFDGSPVITALGIGPCTKAEARFITKRFNCIK